MEQHDLLFIVNASSYKNCYLHSLTTSLSEIISISDHQGCFSRIGVLIYRDYEYNRVIEWSGWLSQGQHEPSQEQQPDLIAFVKRSYKTRERKYHPAVKTALAKASEVMRANAKTLIFLYAEKRPNLYDGPISKEKTALLNPGSYSRYGPACMDWVSTCNTLRDGPKQAQVFSILNEFVMEGDAAWYTYLSTRTDGTCVQVKSYLPEDIAQVTVDLLITWMGVEKAPSSTKGQEEGSSAELVRYISVSEIECLDNEIGTSTDPYFSATGRWIDRNENITRIKLTRDVMKECVPRKTAPVPDSAEEIESLINSVPTTEVYPCVFLDPTLSFPDINYGTESGKKRATSDLTRSELLQIGRSCNHGVLRRYGAILTRLTIVSSAREMPDHISNNNLPKIPLVLVTEQYNNQFWKVLLHTIEPGTKLSARSAALLAALSLRMGIVPLIKAAEQYLTDNQSRILNPTDRTLFERLVICKLLEQAIWIPLRAQVPWIPNNALASIGPIVTCRECEYPRSVTIMGPDRKCGLCLGEYGDQKEKETSINTGVSKDVTATSRATWVECTSISCRAQYIIYSPYMGARLAKCYYCRGQGSPAPTVQCNKCSNHMIWPKEYRPSAFKKSDFICPPCTSGLGPTADVRVTPYRLSLENTYSWLVHDANEPRAWPFPEDSIFQTITRIGSEGFLSRISPFPSSKPQLRYNGKLIHNSKTLISILRARVANSTASNAKCSLCFNRYMYLYSACGRDGCRQKMCVVCLVMWYKSNSAGCVINPAVLGCPFCRRYPTLRLVVKYGLGIHAVKDLSEAVRGRGKFIYAWCRKCDTAKVVMEQSCMKPLELAGWVCDECREAIKRR